MKTGPKFKICRRLGDNVFGKCQTTKFSISGSPKGAGGKPRGRGRAMSEYGTQLLEKQKARYTYGMSEHQFARYVKAHRQGPDLYQVLESRLDNAVFRLGWTTSRAAARQFVTHGHVRVNGRRMNTPSYAVKVGDELAIDEKSLATSAFSNLAERLKDHQLPAWLESEKVGQGKVKTKPVGSEGELNLNFGAIIDFYSRV